MDPKVKTLIKDLKNRNPDIRQATVGELGKLQVEEAIKPLIKMAKGVRGIFKRYNVSDQLVAIKALAETGSKKALRFIEKTNIRVSKDYYQDWDDSPSHSHPCIVLVTEKYRYPYAKGALKKELKGELHMPKEEDEDDKTVKIIKNALERIKETVAGKKEISKGGFEDKFESLKLEQTKTKLKEIMRTEIKLEKIGEFVEAVLLGYFVGIPLALAAGIERCSEKIDEIFGKPNIIDKAINRIRRIDEKLICNTPEKKLIRQANYKLQFFISDCGVSDYDKKIYENAIVAISKLSEIGGPRAEKFLKRLYHRTPEKDKMGIGVNWAEDTERSEYHYDRWTVYHKQEGVFSYVIVPYSKIRETILRALWRIEERKQIK